MTKLESMHIEFLNEMINHKNEEWALEAYNELKELKVQYAEKGIILV
ncbi:MAG: hypothetical protein ACPGUE_11975 [Marinomonas sp.]